MVLERLKKAIEEKGMKKYHRATTPSCWKELRRFISRVDGNFLLTEVFVQQDWKVKPHLSCLAKKDRKDCYPQELVLDLIKTAKKCGIKNCKHPEIFISLDGSIEEIFV